MRRSLSPVVLIILTALAVVLTGCGVGLSGTGQDPTGEVVGSDLFAQWSDAVITPDEPEVVEAATWEVDGEWPSVATATLADATVAVDGELVPMADVAFHKGHFGCVAG